MLGVNYYCCLILCDPNSPLKFDILTTICSCLATRECQLTVHGHVGNMYLNLVAMATGGKQSTKDTLYFIPCIIGFMRCKYHIYTAETLNRVSIFVRKAGFCLRKRTMKLGVEVGYIS